MGTPHLAPHRPPPPAGSPAANYLAGLTRREISTTLVYSLRCGAPQLKRYFEDMRELVLELSEITPLKGPYDPPPIREPLRAFAYLHLGLAHLDVPFTAVLPAYALSPGQDEELARVTVHLATTFLPPSEMSHLATAGFYEGDESHRGGGHCGDVEVGERISTELGTGRHASHVPRDPGLSAFARRHSELGVGSVASSFVLNEKRALFDSSLPLLPDGLGEDTQLEKEVRDRGSRRRVEDAVCGTRAAREQDGAPQADRHPREAGKDSGRGNCGRHLERQASMPPLEEVLLPAAGAHRHVSHSSRRRRHDWEGIQACDADFCKSGMLSDRSDDEQSGEPHGAHRLSSGRRPHGSLSDTGINTSSEYAPIGSHSAHDHLASSAACFRRSSAVTYPGATGHFGAGSDYKAARTTYRDTRGRRDAGRNHSRHARVKSFASRTGSVLDRALRLRAQMAEAANGASSAAGTSAGAAWISQRLRNERGPGGGDLRSTGLNFASEQRSASGASLSAVLHPAMLDGGLERAEADETLLSELFFEAALGEDAVNAALAEYDATYLQTHPSCASIRDNESIAQAMTASPPSDDPDRSGAVLDQHHMEDGVKKALSPVPGSPCSGCEARPSDGDDDPVAVGEVQAIIPEEEAIAGEGSRKTDAKAEDITDPNRLFLCLEVRGVQVTRRQPAHAQDIGGHSHAGTTRQKAQAQSYPRRANFYMICRFNPELLGEPVGQTMGGHYEGHKLRTRVAWGCDATKFALKHTAPLVGRAVLESEASMNEKEAPDGRSVVPTATEGELLHETILTQRRFDRWSIPHELVLEVWEVDSSSQEEDLAALIRCRVALPGGIESRLYTTRVSDGWLSACNPFDGMEWGQVDVRLTLGTAAQIHATEMLRWAVATLQKTARAWLARREVSGRSAGNSSEEDAWDARRGQHQYRMHNGSDSPRQVQARKLRSAYGARGQRHHRQWRSEPALAERESTSLRMSIGAGLPIGSSRDSRHGERHQPRYQQMHRTRQRLSPKEGESEIVLRTRAAVATSGGRLAQWEEEVNSFCDDGYSGADAAVGDEWISRSWEKGGAWTISDEESRCNEPAVVNRQSSAVRTGQASRAERVGQPPLPEVLVTRRWHFVVRVARLSELRVLLPELRAGSRANGYDELGDGHGCIYVHYRWDGGGVVAPLSGETGPVRCSDGASFCHERSLRVHTSLDDAEFRAFLQTQSINFELWQVPPGAQTANLFTHTLLGTATASLAEAVGAGPRGASVECRVTPAIARASRVPALGTEPWRGHSPTGHGRLATNGECTAMASLFVGFAIGGDDPISVPLELPHPSALHAKAPSGAVKHLEGEDVHRPGAPPASNEPIQEPQATRMTALATKEELEDGPIHPDPETKSPDVFGHIQSARIGTYAHASLTDSSFLDFGLEPEDLLHKTPSLPIGDVGDLGCLSCGPERNARGFCELSSMESKTYARINEAKDDRFDVSGHSFRESGDQADLKQVVARDLEYAQRVLASLAERDIGGNGAKGRQVYRDWKSAGVENGRESDAQVEGDTRPCFDDDLGDVEPLLTGDGDSIGRRTAAPQCRHPLRLLVTSVDLPASEAERAAAGALYRVRVVLPGAVCIDSSPLPAIRLTAAGAHDEVEDGEKASCQYEDPQAAPRSLRINVHLSHIVHIESGEGATVPAAELQLWRVACNDQGKTDGSRAMTKRAVSELNQMVGCAFISLKAVRDDERCSSEPCHDVAAEPKNTKRPLLIVQPVDSLTTDGSIDAAVACVSDEMGSLGYRCSETSPRAIDAQLTECASPMDASNNESRESFIKQAVPPELASTVGRWQQYRPAGAERSMGDFPAPPLAASSDAFGHAQPGLLLQRKGAEALDNDTDAAPKIISLAACLRDLDDISASLNDRLVRSCNGGRDTGGGSEGNVEAKFDSQPAHSHFEAVPHLSTVQEDADHVRDGEASGLARPVSSEVSEEPMAPYAKLDLAPALVDVDAAPTQGQVIGHASLDAAALSPTTPPPTHCVREETMAASPRTSPSAKLASVGASLSPHALKRIARILDSKPFRQNSFSDSD